jgi:hemoglobin/transferrin/lactoferrin receptor protein
MNKVIVGFVSFFIVHIAFSQQKDTIATNEEVIVYANKFPEKTKRIAQTIVSLNAKQLNNQPNIADGLINSGQVFVQKSQQGGGSPVIRGFEASRVLLMVDGMRMNNAIYRAGHLQNIITVDNLVLNNVEILYGPSSTLFGSDALGGVVHMFTKNPLLSKTNNTEITGSATTRFSTAINEFKANAQVNIGGKKWASFTSITNSSFGDMIQGKNRLEAYPNFGLQPFIVKRFNNTDSATLNPNPNNQTPSGYKQIDITQKILFKPNNNSQHLINIQISNSTDIPRYDRLTETSSGNPAFAEWYYGPQVRTLLGYSLNSTNTNGFFKDIKLVCNYQHIEESRITRRFKNNNKDFRWEAVDVFGFTIDAKHYSKKNELHLGAESYFNFISSTAERVNIATGAKSRIQTRYSDGPTYMHQHALYAQHTFKISRNLTLNDGLRFSLVNLQARFADTSIMRLPFNLATQKHLAITGNIGLVFDDNKNRIAFVLSSGFRSPNIDDLSKVFETTIGRVVVPNTNLKPEYTYNAELNFKKTFGSLQFGGSLFYTWFTNAIVVDKFQFNGNDSILYNNVRSGVVAPQNKANAFVYGFNVFANVAIAKNTLAEATYTFTYGDFKNNNTTVPLDHIPPTYGRVAITHTQSKWQAQAFVLFNGWKRLDRYSPSGEDNLQYATKDGMPGWYTLNINTQVDITPKLTAQLGIENILDRNYRYFASGISAAGLNISGNLNFKF